MSEIKAIEKLCSIWKQLPAPTHYDELLLADMDACIKAIEAEIAERYIKLPTDKNGNVIHVGDMVKHADGKVYEVLGVDNDGTRQGVFINTGDDRYPIDSWCASGMELYKPRTLEDIVQDAIQYGYSHGKAGMDVSEQRDKYANEIRKLFGGDAE